MIKNECDLIFEKYVASRLQEEGILNNVGDKVGRGIQTVGNKISNVGAGMTQSATGIGKMTPEQIAEKFSSIKKEKGEKVLQSYIESLSRKNPDLLKKVIEVARSKKEAGGKLNRSAVDTASTDVPDMPDVDPTDKPDGEEFAKA